MPGKGNGNPLVFPGKSYGGGYMDRGAWWGGGMGRSCLTGTEFICEMKAVLEMDGGDGYTIMNMNLMSLNCTLKMVNFMLYVS